MLISHSHFLNNEWRGITSLRLSPGQIALVARNDQYYKEALREKQDRILSAFRDFPSFDLNLPFSLVELDCRAISRLQGVFYMPPEHAGEDGVYYLNTGYLSPEYFKGDRNITPADVKTMSNIVRSGERIRLSGRYDGLNFNVTDREKYTITTVKD